MILLDSSDGGGAGPQCLAQLMRVRHLVSATIAKQDEDRTQRYLSAASRGDAGVVRSVRLPRTCPPAQCRFGHAPGGLRNKPPRHTLLPGGACAGALVSNNCADKVGPR